MNRFDNHAEYKDLNRSQFREYWLGYWQAKHWAADYGHAAAEAKLAQFKQLVRDGSPGVAGWEDWLNENPEKPAP